MTDASKFGTDWDDDELDAIVTDYFVMLDDEVAGRPYVKAEHNRQLAARIGRSRGSIEFKYMNVSAVLEELGMRRVKGYLPAANRQDAIIPAIDRYLRKYPKAFESPYPVLAGMAEASPLMEGPAPDLRPVKHTPTLQRLVRKWDPSERDFRNRKLGKEGEEAVVNFEQARLERLERPDLARKVRWVAQLDGDGAGYDIHSFDAAGRDRLIEVKTTAGHSRTPFFITRNERSLADERPDAFRLYRLYDFAETPSLFRLRPPLEQHVTFEGETWRASFG